MDETCFVNSYLNCVQQLRPHCVHPPIRISVFLGMDLIWSLLAIWGCSLNRRKMNSNGIHIIDDTNWTLMGQTFRNCGIRICEGIISWEHHNPKHSKKWNAVCQIAVLWTSFTERVNQVACSYWMKIPRNSVWILSLYKINSSSDVKWKTLYVKFTTNMFRHHLGNHLQL